MADKVFLRAEWRKLLMVNYAAEPSSLLPYLPAHTEIDTWNNKCYVSLVGFMFLNTKVRGIAFPGHTNFCEVNLRFYVKHNINGQWQRGVVFIKEFVPKRVIAFIANTFYNENYAAVTMKHHWQENPDSLTANYSWKNGQWNSFGIVTESKSVPIIRGSEEEFIAEHYWGYTKHNKSVSLEYKVEHPVWKIYPVKNHSVDVDFAKAYGEQWKFLNSIKPQSVLLAEGSEISVGSKRKLR